MLVRNQESRNMLWRKRIAQHVCNEHALNKLVLCRNIVSKVFLDEEDSTNMSTIYFTKTWFSKDEHLRNNHQKVCASDMSQRNKQDYHEVFSTRVFNMFPWPNISRNNCSTIDYILNTLSPQRESPCFINNCFSKTLSNVSTKVLHMEFPTKHILRHLFSKDQDFHFLLQNPPDPRRVSEGFQKGFLKGSLKGFSKGFRRVLEGFQKGF